MTAASIIAAASSDNSILQNIGEVILFGAIAGIGIAVAFSLMVRGFLMADAARRDSRGNVAVVANTAMGVIFAAVCVAAVVFALVVMLHR
jgi:hypothetical protein